jgi:hypothetical protein
MPTYFSGQEIAAGDIFASKNNADLVQRGETNYAIYRVTRVTAKRGYYVRVYHNGEDYGSWESHSEHRMFNRSYILVRRGLDYKASVNVKPSGFARFVKGCDQGKIGRKKRKPRVKKIEAPLTHEEIHGTINI